MAENPKTYQLDAEVAGVIWAALFESANDELARLLSDTMIEQGCQELAGVTDSSLILMFWKNYMEDNNILTFRPADKELN
jgi:hypothetical protein|tara:strand:- start:193 stop:432 length:240 start_codon:yes stop_codon:yes gene_type:complete